MIAKIFPKLISEVLTLGRMRRLAGKFKENPRATNGGVITIIVTVICLYAESIGMEFTPEMQTQLAGTIALIGGIYTTWRAGR